MLGYFSIVKCIDTRVLNLLRYMYAQLFGQYILWDMLLMFQNEGTSACHEVVCISNYVALMVMSMILV